MLQTNGATQLPFFFVGRTLTNERISRFAKTKHSLLTKEIGKPETKSIWYTKEHISFLLDEMNKADADGLRIYFGTYGANENYSGQLCLLMVMTEPNGVGGHKDISIEDAPNFQERAVDQRSPRDFNIGNPCPPMCDPEDNTK